MRIDSFIIHGTRSRFTCSGCHHCCRRTHYRTKNRGGSTIGGLERCFSRRPCQTMGSVSTSRTVRVTSLLKRSNQFSSLGSARRRFRHRGTCRRNCRGAASSHIKVFVTNTLGHVCRLTSTYQGKQLRGASRFASGL